ncbi:DUF2931 family protein [Flavobacterium hercynium]|uniref:DUF2931 domain-containing protein n=1 Tax=Flavobacterium hercynium TaxID=387094 RepID=A0A226GWE4_9FLAO|nr:DUF2931 family protein [Flavobacterium hercynium]OXA85888.1 hypothetical protein B0A66_18695 [Flavobacterium hercynium]SMP33719.1 Protein of unknown function [Flavobacterium hercynium]
MNIIRTNIYTLALLFTLTISCQNKKENKEMNIEKFYYQPTITCPLGYPVEVYRGGLESQDGSFEPLNLGTHTGKGGWGHTGGSMSSGIKSIPNRLNLIWVSYAEDTFYSIDCDIDYNKMVEKFKEGYQDSAFFFNKNGKYKKETYSYIVVGFAPGGIVVVWLAGSGRQVEIGRYEGEKIVVSNEEIAKLDNHDRLIFQQDYREKTMLNEKIVPIEVQQANKNKAIPYGVWDVYRKRYTWRPSFDIQKEGTMIDTRLDMFNGEFEEQFDQVLVKNEFTERAIPKRVNIGWRDNTGQNYSGTMYFDEKEIFDAFNTIYKDDKNKKAQLEFRVNILNTFITVLLKSDDQEISLPKTKIDVFKSRKRY